MPSQLAQRGLELLEAERCITCHSFDGSLRDGPTFLGLAGSTRTVITDGVVRTVVADEGYLARSIRDPGADIVEGFRTPMPRQILDNGQIAAIVTALVEMPRTAPPPRDTNYAPLFVGLVVVVVGAILFFRRKRGVTAPT